MPSQVENLLSSARRRSRPAESFLSWSLQLRKQSTDYSSNLILKNRMKNSKDFLRFLRAWTLGGQAARKRSAMSGKTRSTWSISSNVMAMKTERSGSGHIRSVGGFVLQYQTAKMQRRFHAHKVMK